MGNSARAAYPFNNYFGYSNPEPEPDRYCEICSNQIPKEPWVFGYDVCSDECEYVWLQIHPVCTMCKDFLELNDDGIVCVRCQGKVIVMKSLAEIYGNTVTIPYEIFKIGFYKPYEESLFLLAYTIGDHNA